MTECLIVVHPDGYAEAFGPKQLRVRFAMMPHLPGSDPVLGDPRCEELLGELLPLAWRRWYFPGYLRGSEKLHRDRPSAILDRLHKRDCFDALDLLTPTRDAPRTKGGRQWIA